MRFTALAVIDTVSLLVSTAVGMCMAMSGYGYWALVGMTVTAPLISTASLWLATAWVPVGPRRYAGVPSMIRFGGTAPWIGLVIYVAYNLWKVLLARFLGSDALAIWLVSYR